MQKLAASLADKGLSQETGVSASDEDTYGIALETFLQYLGAVDAVDQIGTHAYQGIVIPFYKCLGAKQAVFINISFRCRYTFLTQSTAVRMH